MGEAVREEDGKQRPHLLVIPHCTQGHITPALRFCKQVARRGGVTITLVSYETELCRLRSEDPELENLDLTLLGLPRPDEVPRYPRQTAEVLEKSFEPLKEKLIRDQRAGIAGPTCIVSDTFILWPQDLASELSIPNYIFIASGACLARFILATNGLIVEGKLGVNPEDSTLQKFDGKISISGLPAMHYHELPSTIRIDPLYFQARSRFCGMAAGIIMNTFYELEDAVIDTMRSISESTMIKTPKYYPVGPLFPTPIVSVTNSSVVFGLEDSQQQCMRWLDSQPDSSVLYICFGTLFRLDAREIKELALALERSKQRFLWVLPLPKVISSENENAGPLFQSVTDMLPPGFEARVGELGCIVTGWAPQIQVLSHQSTSGFLTHCGWNSCLEGVTLGVPMLAWPLGAEQHMNCRLLVDELKVAAEIQRGVDGIMEAKEIERKVMHLMVEEVGKVMKNRVGQLKVKAAAAVAVGGSSPEAVDQFVEDIKNL